MSSISASNGDSAPRNSMADCWPCCVCNRIVSTVTLRRTNTTRGLTSRLVVDPRSAHFDKECLLERGGPTPASPVAVRRRRNRVRNRLARGGVFASSGVSVRLRRTPVRVVRASRHTAVSNIAPTRRRGPVHVPRRAVHRPASIRRLRPSPVAVVVARLRVRSGPRCGAHDRDFSDRTRARMDSRHRDLPDGVGPVVRPRLLHVCPALPLRRHQRGIVGTRLSPHEPRRGVPMAIRRRCGCDCDALFVGPLRYRARVQPERDAHEHVRHRPRRNHARLWLPADRRTGAFYRVTRLVESLSDERLRLFGQRTSSPCDRRRDRTGRSARVYRWTVWPRGGSPRRRRYRRRNGNHRVVGSLPRSTALALFVRVDSGTPLTTAEYRCYNVARGRFGTVSKRRSLLQSHS